MNAETRQAIEEFVPWLRKLQFTGQGYRDGQVFDTFGVVYVPDPYERRAQKEKEITPSRPPGSRP